MKVYVVLGGWQYEGCDQASVQVFTELSAAGDYAHSLVDTNADMRYDYFRIIEREVIV